MRLSLQVGLGAALLSLGLAPAANAHFLSWDSVDGGEIRYENYSTFGEVAWARDRWNNVGTVNIAADSATTIADLEIRNYNSLDGLCGKAAPRSGADLMSLNYYYYSGYSTDRRRACTLHEFGHTLRLDHSYTTQAMDECPVCSNPAYVVSPQGHDQADYHAIWG